MKINWKGLLIPLGILGGLIVLGIALSFGAESCGRATQLKEYSHKVNKIPLVATNKLPKDFKLKIALEELNKESKKILWKLEGKKYRGPTIEFLPAPKDEYLRLNRNNQRGLCHWSNNKSGTIDFANRKVYICTSKLQEAWKNRHKAKLAKDHGKLSGSLAEMYAINKFNGFINKQEKAAGFINTLKHEAMHWFIPNHLTWGCVLMCEKPTFGYLGSAELDILNKVIK